MRGLFWESVLLLVTVFVEEVTGRRVRADSWSDLQLIALIWAIDSYGMSPEILRLGEADAVLAEIEDGVVAADEDVAEDPQVSEALGQVDAHEARQTDRLSSSGNLRRSVRRVQVPSHS